jgi:hypothetical protein
MAQPGRNASFAKSSFFSSYRNSTVCWLGEPLSRDCERLLIAYSRTRKGAMVNGVPGLVILAILSGTPQLAIAILENMYCTYTLSVRSQLELATGYQDNFYKNAYSVKLTVFIKNKNFSLKKLHFFPKSSL